MTTFSGYVEPGLDWASWDTLLESRAPALTSAQAIGAASFDETPTWLSGTFARHNVSIRSLALSGVAVPAYFEDFYNQVYVIPTNTTLGFVAGPTTGEFILWNAWLRNETIASETDTGLTGISISGPAPSYVMRPLETVVYVVTAGIVGPVTIQATRRFTFSPSSEVRIAEITGQRAVTWPLATNWKDSVIVTYEYKTDIIESRGEYEQRRALRSTPRKTIEFTTTAMSAADVRALHEFMQVNQRVVALVEEPGCKVRTTAPVASTDVSISVGAGNVPNWLVSGVTLRVGGNGGPLVDVSGVNNATGVVSFLSQVGAAYPTNTKASAMRAGYLPDAMTSKRPTNRVADMKVKVQVVPVSEPAFAPNAAATAYASLEVLTDSPDWGKEIGEDYSYKTETIDFGQGLTQRYTVSPRGTRTIKAAYWRNGAETCLMMRDAFMRALGRQGEFLMPMFDEDLPLREDIGAGANSIRVQGQSTYAAMQLGFPFEHIAILLNDGTAQYLSVTGSFPVSDVNGDDSVITFSTTLTAVAMSAIKRVAWMPTWRFASDLLTMEWVSDEVGVATVAMQTRPYSAGSGPA